MSIPVPRIGPGSLGRGQRSTFLVAAVVLTLWAQLTLGSDLPALLVAAALAFLAVWVLRHRTEVAACAAITLGAAAVPAVICVVLTENQVLGAQDVVPVLTGYILVAPIPALVACTLRPVLVAAPLNALLGSAVLLLGAASGVVLGDHGEGAAVLVAALTVSVALIRYRHRRVAAALLAALPLLNGWTDLGRRTLPDGSRVDRLLIGKGQVITCSATVSAVSEKGAIAAVRTAATAARTLGVACDRVQPVILTEQEKPGMQRHLVNNGEVAASVIVTAQDHIEDVQRLAPGYGRHQRRAVLTAALLPVPTERNPQR